MLLQLQSACFKYGDVTIFENVNLEVNEGDSIGLVGANGAGKSTLLSVIADGARLFSGNIYKKSNLNIGYLKQNCDFISENTLFAEMMSVFDEQTKLLAEINNVAEKISDVDAKSDEFRILSERYHRLMMEADASEAYSSELKVKTVLNGMGMAQFSDRIVSTLSGGEKTKAALCKMLLQRPELMILDEPTNHLDYKTLDWLENFLSDKKSTLLVVSHDRYFLDKLCSKIWDVQHKEVQVYTGNYTKYKVLKAEKTENYRREYEKQQKEIEKLSDYVAKNRARASTADMAKSREKALERMTILDVPKREEQPPRFKFSYSSEPSEFPLTVQKLTLAFGERVLLKDIQFQIRRGQKVALLGLNGTGKSTLIKRIADPQPTDLGKIVFGKNVRVGYYDQENKNLQGNLRVLDQLWFDNTRMSQTEVRGLLAAVTLGVDDVCKSVSELSGGERAKLGLTMLMAKDCNLLLLDEPTNHLDLPSREALEQALKNYTGTVLFVSHDRYFVNSVADVIAEIDNNSITVYNGNYDDFANRKSKNEVAREQKQAGNYRSPKQRAEQVNKAKRVKDLEQQIRVLESEIEQLNNDASKPDVVCDYAKLSVVLEKLKETEFRLENITREWETLLD